MKTPIVHTPQATTIGTQLRGLVKGPLRAIEQVVKHVFHPNIYHRRSKSGRKKEKNMFEILENVSGYAEPGDMVLLLTPPKAGTSTLLQVLSGQYSSYLAKNDVEDVGAVYYNGMDLQRQGSKKGAEKLVNVVKNWIRFIDQGDMHFAIPTVRQTLQFAADCRSEPGVPFAEKLKQDRMLLVARVLGIEEVLDTKVGDELVRGISGGEKRRVTIAEQLVGGLAQIFLFDNMSTGLDAATTLDIVRSIREIAKNLGLVIIMSLQQPSSETFNEFDKVGVLDSGSMLYYGPRAEAETFFTGLGVERPPGRSVPDYLITAADPKLSAGPKDTSGSSGKNDNVEVTPSGSSSNAGESTPSENVPAAIRAAYEASPHYQKVMQVIDKHVQSMEWTLERYHSDVPESERRALEAKAPNPFWSQMKFLLRRSYVLNVGDRKSLISSLLVPTIVAIVIGLLFLRIPTNQSGTRTRTGILFLTLIYSGFQAIGTIDEKYKQRLVHMKQSEAGFYRPGAFAFANISVDIGLAFVRCLLFTACVYFLAGLSLASNGARLVYFFLALWGVTVAMEAFVRMFSFAFSSQDVATALMGLVVMMFIVFSGFLLVKSEIADYFIWIYWVSPFRYGFEGLVVNEFSGTQFTCEDDELVPPAPDGVLPRSVRVCPVGDGGVYARESVGVIVNGWIKWLDLAYLFVFAIVCFLLAIFFLQRLKSHLSSHKAKRNDIGEGTDDTKCNKYKFKCPDGSGSAVVEIENDPKKPMRPMTLAWKNLNYSVPLPKSSDMKQLLHDVSGMALPGRICALMGSSGAGKSTTMNALCLRQGAGDVNGDVHVNGYERNKYFPRIIGYCEQMDIHTDECTVRESIQFSADLRLSQDVSKEEKVRMVDQCLETLDLLSVQDHVIRGLSAEALKRVTIGVELAANPSILFLDEPTSNLSSGAALTVMRAVREVAKLGCAVVCTIHQPSSELFETSFDDLLLLQRGGKTVYFGELGPRGRTLIDYMERNGASKITPERNPADWMLDETGAGTSKKADAKDWSEIWNVSPEKAHVLEKVDKALEQQGEDISFDRKRATSLMTQFKVLFARSRAVYWRKTEYNWTRMVLSVVQGLLLGIIFLQPDRDQVGLFTLFSALFLSLLPAGNQTTNIIGPSLRGRTVLKREIAAGTYGERAYHVATGLIEVPYVSISTAIYSVLLYFLVGLRSAKFGYFILASILINLFGVYIGIFVAYASATPAIAFMIAPVVQIFGNLFSGFLITRSAFPVYLKWVLWINPYAYFLTGIAKNEYRDASFTCDPDQLVPFQLPTDGRYSSCSAIPGFPDGQIGQLRQNVCSYCPVVLGDQLLESFGVTGFSKWIDLVAVAGFVVLARIGGYIALKLYTKKSK